jgi:hypothetical protein
MQIFIVAELKGYIVSELQACPTDINNPEIENEISRSVGVAELQSSRFQNYRVTDNRIKKFTIS